jgi:hypothetical protein
VINPTNGKVIMTVSEATADDADRAVKAARAAFTTTWGLHCPGAERGKLLNKLANIMEENFDELAAVEALDNGARLSLFPTFFFFLSPLPGDRGPVLYVLINTPTLCCTVRQDVCVGEDSGHLVVDRVHPLLRRLGGQEPRQGHRNDRGQARVHASRAQGRVWPGHPLELSA